VVVSTDAVSTSTDEIAQPAPYESRGGLAFSVPGPALWLFQVGRR
jgi:hypothetical protein